MATILSRLLACFPEADTSETAKTDRFRGYMIAVERFPVEALDEAVIRVLQGRAYIKGKRINLSFCPSPPELAMICDDAAADQSIARAKDLQRIFERPREAPATIEVETRSAELNTIIAKVVEKARME